MTPKLSLSFVSAYLSSQAQAFRPRHQSASLEDKQSSPPVPSTWHLERLSHTDIFSSRLPKFGKWVRLKDEGCWEISFLAPPAIATTFHHPGILFFVLHWYEWSSSLATSCFLVERWIFLIAAAVHRQVHHPSTLGTSDPRVPANHPATIRPVRKRLKYISPKLCSFLPHLLLVPIRWDIHALLLEQERPTFFP